MVKETCLVLLLNDEPGSLKAMCSFLPMPKICKSILEPLSLASYVLHSFLMFFEFESRKLMLDFLMLTLLKKCLSMKCLNVFFSGMLRYSSRLNVLTFEKFILFFIRALYSGIIVPPVAKPKTEEGFLLI